MARANLLHMGYSYRLYVPPDAPGTGVPTTTKSDGASDPEFSDALPAHPDEAQGA